MGMEDNRCPLTTPDTGFAGMNKNLIAICLISFCGNAFSKDLSESIASKSMIGYKVNSYEYLAVAAVFAPLANRGDLSTPMGPTLSADIGVGGMGSALGYSFQRFSHAINPRLLYFRKFDRETHEEGREWAGLEAVFLATNHIPGNISLGVVTPLGARLNEWRLSVGIGLGW